MDLQELGTLLRSRRRELGLMLGAVASKAGISRSYLYAMESGRNPSTGKASRPSEEVLERLTYILQLDPYRIKLLADYSATIPVPAVSRVPPLNRVFHPNPIVNRLVEIIEDPNMESRYKRLLENQLESLLNWIDHFAKNRNR